MATATLVSQASPASAATKLDGVWTIEHGATGQVLFNGDSTFISTCQTIAKLPATNCPPPSGTFAFNGAYVTVDPHGCLDAQLSVVRNSGHAPLPIDT